MRMTGCDLKDFLVVRVPKRSNYIKIEQALYVHILPTK